MLLNGGQLVLCTENRLLDSEQLKQEINSRGVTKMWFTSSWFNQLVDNDITVFKNLKTILAGGEKLELIQKDHNESTPGTNGERGSGLGLYLVKEMLKKINAQLQVESTLGKGSKFIIKIPS